MLILKAHKNILQRFLSENTIYIYLGALNHKEHEQPFPKANATFWNKKPQIISISKGVAALVP